MSVFSRFDRDPEFTTVLASACDDAALGGLSRVEISRHLLDFFISGMMIRHGDQHTLALLLNAVRNINNGQTAAALKKRGLSVANDKVDEPLVFN